MLRRPRCVLIFSLNNNVVTQGQQLNVREKPTVFALERKKEQVRCWIEVRMFSLRENNNNNKSFL